MQSLRYLLYLENRSRISRLYMPLYEPSTISVVPWIEDFGKCGDCRLESWIRWGEENGLKVLVNRGKKECTDVINAEERDGVCGFFK